MKKLILSTIFGFLGTFVVASLIAIFILQNLVNESLGVVRTMEEGLNFPAILIGYFLLALGMSVLYPKIKDSLGGKWYLNGFVFGYLVGVTVFIAGHLIVAGWSVIPATPLVIAGFFDSFAPAFGGIIISFFYRNKYKNSR